MDDEDKQLDSRAMEIFDEWPRTKIIFGNDTIRFSGKFALDYGKRAFIVIGGNSVKSFGQLDLLTESLKKAKVEYSIFEGVEPNPSKETIEAIAETYNKDKYNVTIALGGGSPMDAAKAALILTTLKTNDLTPFFGVDNVSKKMKRISPLICIPTTSGTSSEITRYSNITIKELGVKKLISDIAIHPHVAIVDPKLTISCHKDLTLTVGLDTLTHSMEGYLNTIQDVGNEDINERAMISIKLVYKWLKKASEEPENMEARRMMSIASVLGGTVIGGVRFKGTGGPHMNSFSWSNFLDHGKATGLMLPYYIVYYAKNPKVVEKLRPIAKLFNVNVTESIGRDIAQAMLDWYKSMGFVTRLKDCKGWEERYLEKALTDAVQNEMKLKAMPNPVPLEKIDEVLRPILEAARDGDLSLIK